MNDTDLAYETGREDAIAGATKTIRALPGVDWGLSGVEPSPDGAWVRRDEVLAALGENSAAPFISAAPASFPEGLDVERLARALFEVGDPEGYGFISGHHDYAAAIAKAYEETK